MGTTYLGAACKESVMNYLTGYDLLNVTKVTKTASKPAEVYIRYPTKVL